MTKISYKVLITTSGFGQRLGEITKYTNKALVRVGKKPVISYIIESYPSNVECVITLRHFGHQIKDFVKLAYPKRKFTFVEESEIPKEGGCFSLGSSMLAARKYLQCPFIFQCCDTIVTEPIPKPDHNWNGVYKSSDSAQYSSVTALDGYIQKINSKGALEFDFLHIGLVGINDFKNFWKILEGLLKENPLDSSLNDCKVINNMMKDGHSFRTHEFKSWYDTGNTEGLHRARESIQDAFPNLEKLKESLFLFDNFAIKFFFEEDTVKNRVKRGKILNGLVPSIEGATKNFFRYKFIDGELYSRVVTPHDFTQFLSWSKKHLWKKKTNIDLKKFPAVCHDFYFTKSLNRIEKFFNLHDLKDHETIINSERIPQIRELFAMIDFDWLSQAEPYQFHGDFILDNILKTSKGYCLLDWRQDFGGLLEAGDIYYDLAKLNHNLTVNHDIVSKNLFTIHMTDHSVFCDILRKENLVQCQKVFYDFVQNNNFSWKKIQILTALIWLNMSPLHHYPFNLFLFYFGKLNLWRALEKKDS
ncbi:hypothetical protein HYV56_01235 [Candidatus Peregrinibacteria bacterium]|nr:hypothetical protein [Candidatus Peregrinibacteria bacterium]